MIQVVRSWSCTPGLEKSKRTSAQIQKPISKRETRKATEPAQMRDHGRSQTANAPPSGSRISVVVSQPEYVIAARRPSRSQPAVAKRKPRQDARSARIRRVRARPRTPRGDALQRAADREV